MLLSPAVLWYVWHADVAPDWLNPTYRDQGWHQAFLLISERPILE